MIGDASVIPAISASLERIPAGVPVHVLLEVEDDREQQPLATPGELRLEWFHSAEALLAAVRELDFPSGIPQAFVHGEASTVRELRRHLLGERGLPRAAVSVSGYWKRTRTEEGWRDDKAEWNRQVEQDLAG
jgi:NADPH-dependent ferric siderophore reductase